MANSVTIRTTAPGAKEAAGDVLGLRSAFDKLGVGGGALGPITRGLTSNIGGMALAFGGATAAAGAINGVMQQAGQFLGQATMAAADEEIGIRKLDTILQTNVKSWDGNTAAIEEQIKKREDLAFSDDELRDSLGKLVVRTGNVEQGFRDQGLAMDIARGRSIDLAEATDIVNKAALGNTRALKTMGIEVDKNATGAEILAELQRRYAGQAETYANTARGALESLNVELQDVNEELGAHLLPATKGLATVAKTELVPALEDAADALGTLLGAATGARADQLALVDVLKSFVPPGYQDLVPQYQEFGKHEGEAFLDGLGKSLKSGLPTTMGAEVGGGLVTGVADGVSGGVDELRNAFGGLFHNAAPSAKRAAGDLGHDTAVGFSDNLGQTIHDAIPDAKSRWQDYIDAVMHPKKRAKDIAFVEGKLASEALHSGLTSDDPGIKHDAEALQAYLISQWEALSGKAYTAGSDTGKQLGAGIDDSTPGAVTQARQLANQVNAQIDKIPNKVNIRITTWRNGRSNDSGGASDTGGVDTRATGGPVAGNGIYEVNERGDPEVLTSAGKTYLLMGRNSGQVEPIRGAAPGGVAPSPGMPTRIDVHVNLNTREFAQHQKHYAVVQAGGPAFR